MIVVCCSIQRSQTVLNVIECIAISIQCLIHETQPRRICSFFLNSNSGSVTMQSNVRVYPLQVYYRPASDSDVITPPIPFPGLPTHPVSTDSQLVLGDVTKVSIRFGYTSQQLSGIFFQTNDMGMYGGMYLPPYFFCHNTLFFSKKYCVNTLFFQKILCCAPCPQHNIFLKK